ncbi:transporter associated domain-containing protein [Acinetobacter baumannii]
MLRKLPVEGEHFVEQGWRFEVVDMDGRKIDKLLVTRLRPLVPPPVENETPA